MAQLNSSGIPVDTGTAQESKNHGINESLAHARDTFPSLTSVINTGFSYSNGWSDLLLAANGMPAVQDYNMILGDYTSPPFNPIITGMSPVNALSLGWNINNGDGDEFISSSAYYFYNGSSTSGPTVNLAYQDWIGAGSYLITVGASNNTTSSALGSPTGKVYIYAQGGGGGLASLATLVAGSSNSSNTFAFSSSLVFGQRPWQIYVVHENMGGNYSSLGWGEGYYLDCVGKSGPTADPRDGIYSANPPGNAWEGSGPNFGVPSQGINWEMYTTNNNTYLEGVQQCYENVILVDGTQAVASNQAALFAGTMTLPPLNTVLAWMLSVPNITAWKTPSPGTIVYPTTDPSAGYNGTLPFIDCGGIDSPTSWGDVAGNFNLPTGWSGPSFNWSISGIKTGP